MNHGYKPYLVRTFGREATKDELLEFQAGLLNYLKHYDGSSRQEKRLNREYRGKILAELEDVERKLGALSI